MISTLKDLDNLIRLCRKRGVETIAIEGITFKLGDKPQRTARAEKPAPSILDTIREPTEEELLFWSAGVPSEPVGGDGV